MPTPTLSFTSFDTSDGGSLALTIRKAGFTSGIYWLKFDDGTEYVGQTVNLTQRFSTHRRKQPGLITSMSFAPVEKPHLNAMEVSMIKQRDKEGASLRNKMLTASPGGLETLTITTKEGPTVALPWERDLRGKVPANLRQKRREITAAQAKKWDKLQRNDAWPITRDFLWFFLRETMSSPHLTGGELWTISALPSTNWSRHHYRLCTLNVGRIEAVFVYVDEATGPHLRWNLPLPVGAVEMFSFDWELRKFQDHVALSKARYSVPALALDCSSVGVGLELLRKVPLMAKWSYHFNTVHQREGFTMQRRWHNWEMARDLLKPT